MLPPDMTGGAGGRLLPPSIPFRFFGTAVVMHVFAWVAIVVSGDGLPNFTGGTGPVLMALHILTLGVLLMTAMGAVFQLLPMATKKTVRSQALCNLTYWLFTPGIMVLLLGFGINHQFLMELGATFASGAGFLFVFLLVDNLWHVNDMPVIRLHVGIATLSLFLLLLLGVLLVCDFTLGFLSNHFTIARAHAILAIFGFMGMLTLGLSYILVPMFVLGRAAPNDIGLLSGRLAGAGIFIAAIGGIFEIPYTSIPAAILGVAGIAVYLKAMFIIVKSRMKKQLGDAFVLLRASWILLFITIGIGLALSLGVSIPNGSALFVFVASFGWLLSFLTGILQRIMPYLASMHANRPGKRSPLLSKLVDEDGLKLHLFAHFLGITAVSLGIIAEEGILVQTGGGLGLIGALGFSWFAIQLWRRSLNHLNSP